MTNEPTDEGKPSSPDAKQPDARRPQKARFMDVNSVLSVMGKTVKECTTTDPPQPVSPEAALREQADTCMIRVPDVPLRIDIKPGKGNSAQVQPLFKDPVPTADLGKDFDPYRDMPDGPWNAPAAGSVAPPSASQQQGQNHNAVQPDLNQMFDDAMSQECDMQIDTGVINLSSFPKPLKLTARITNANMPQRVEVPRRTDSKTRLDSVHPEQKQQPEPSKIHQPVSGLLAKLVRKPPQAKVHQEEVARAVEPEESAAPKPVFQRTYTNSIKDNPPPTKHDTGLVDITRITSIPENEQLQQPPQLQESLPEAVATADQLPVVQPQNKFGAFLNETAPTAKAGAQSENSAPRAIPPAARLPMEWFENQNETGRVDIRQVLDLSLDQKIVNAPAPRVEVKINVPIMQTQTLIVSSEPVPQHLLHVTLSGELDDNISLVGMQHSIQICSRRRPQPAGALATGDNLFAVGGARPGFLQGMMKKLGLE